MGLGAVLRYAFAGRSRLHVFAEGKTGWHQISTSVGDADVSQDGFSIWPGLGAKIPVGRTSRVIVSSEATWKTYRDARLFGNALSVPDSSGSLFQYAIRLGLAFGRVP